MTGGELLPATAWEQAAIIGIFIVFAIFVFGWLAKSRKEDRQFQSEESDKWQKFIGEIDDKWRAFNKEQRIENNDSLKCVENSLKDLTTVTQGLVSEVKEMRSDTSVFFENFHQHDAQAQEILNEVKKPRTSRAKKTVANDG
jgi:phytoene dehydrogenase-like protein